MAKPKKKTRRGMSEKNGLALWMKFKRQPAQISMEDVDASLETFNSQGDAIVRRFALVSLARSGAQLIEGVAKDPKLGELLEQQAEETRAYGKRLRILADMMETAAMRLTFASAASLPGAPT